MTRPAIRNQGPAVDVEKTSTITITEECGNCDIASTNLEFVNESVRHRPCSYGQHVNIHLSGLGRLETRNDSGRGGLQGDRELSAFGDVRACGSAPTGGCFNSGPPRR